jgi:hypothetical protein
MINECETPGCSTLTFGRVCLGCEQTQMKKLRRFPRGRPYSSSENAVSGHAEPGASATSATALDPLGS